MGEGGSSFCQQGKGCCHHLQDLHDARNKALTLLNFGNATLAMHASSGMQGAMHHSLGGYISIGLTCKAFEMLSCEQLKF